jgi:DNA-binding NtrC family response regulator
MSSNLPSLQADVLSGSAAQTAPPRRILVVEDDFFLRSVVVDVLRRHGFSVFEARDTDKAWDFLQREAIDLLFTDIRLPGFVDGLALAALVRKSRPAMKIVIASGHIPARAGIDPKTADECLSKPYQFDHMVALIRRLLEDGAPPAATRRRPLTGEEAARMKGAVGAV